ncbi:MAG: LON peptidase substrate-binding domain-containing protein [Bdellovibrio sp.]|nr:LON peptidase substrate-binding domain-containing protein [Bdellovibrio sp.]
MSEVKISLFPIPGSVSLPFDKISLHVFEPRYRKMILDSIESKRRVGIAHTQKMIGESKVKPNRSKEEILNSNHESYLAQKVFSAGFAEIIETLPDGRMLVEITTDNRYEISEVKQAIPYQIVICRTFQDKPEPPVQQLRAELEQILQNIGAETSEDLKKYLQSKTWLQLSDFEYSFKIYSLVPFDPNSMQKVLELKSIAARISFLIDILTRGTLQ